MSSLSFDHFSINQTFQENWKNISYVNGVWKKSQNVKNRWQNLSPATCLGWLPATSAVHSAALVSGKRVHMIASIRRDILSAHSPDIIYENAASPNHGSRRLVHFYLQRLKCKALRSERFLPGRLSLSRK